MVYNLYVVKGMSKGPADNFLLEITHYAHHLENDALGAALLLRFVLEHNMTYSNVCGTTIICLKRV